MLMGGGRDQIEDLRTPVAFSYPGCAGNVDIAVSGKTLTFAAHGWRDVAIPVASRGMLLQWANDRTTSWLSCPYPPGPPTTSADPRPIWSNTVHRCLDRPGWRRSSLKSPLTRLRQPQR